MSLKGKTALITGASAGIGAAVSLLLAEKGVKVLALARRKEKLSALEKSHSSIESVVCDITKDAQKLTEIVERNQIDILINNAGLALGRSSIDQTKTEEVSEMFETNVLALIHLTQKVLPQMIKRKSGDIVNLGSVAGMHAYAGGATYCATKAAVDMFTDGLRLDVLGKGIRVIGIHPGMVETEFSLVRFQGDQKLAKKVYEGMRPLKPEDIAETILWTLERPPHVDIHSLLIMPTDQAGVGAVFRQT